jgi:hypothetical protein
MGLIKYLETDFIIQLIMLLLSYKEAATVLGIKSKINILRVMGLSPYFFRL